MQAHDFLSLARNIPYAHDGEAVDRAASYFEMASVQAGDGEAEGFAATAQFGDAAIETLRGVRRQPGPEGQRAARAGGISDK
ncbi:hypothetical protein RZS28_17090 [Methylocapsa polymorpha]|uniref:Uncharacterized protein n=1 Tax=Methylocapsa polymorpha TaxID=3080828 RepID=A0ABZ0HRE8_9HYPH|nr:hypothetical protein RZS28_17090 [Methylocapsa sp. RX1]